MCWNDLVSQRHREVSASRPALTAWQGLGSMGKGLVMHQWVHQARQPVLQGTTVLNVWLPPLESLRGGDWGGGTCGPLATAIASNHVVVLNHFTVVALGKV